jgi:exonuclease III
MLGPPNRSGGLRAGLLVVCFFFMDPSNVLFWNVRGLNGAARRVAVRKLVSSSKVDVVCLQETKMEDISRITMLQMLGPAFGSFMFLPSVGASGGILMACHERLGCLGNFRIDTHSVSIQFIPGEGRKVQRTRCSSCKSSGKSGRLVTDLR